MHKKYDLNLSTAPKRVVDWVKKNEGSTEDILVLLQGAPALVTSWFISQMFASAPAPAPVEAKKAVAKKPAAKKAVAKKPAAKKAVAKKPAAKKAVAKKPAVKKAVAKKPAAKKATKKPSRSVAGRRSPTKVVAALA